MAGYGRFEGDTHEGRGRERGPERDESGGWGSSIFGEGSGRGSRHRHGGGYRDNQPGGQPGGRDHEDRGREARGHRDGDWSFDRDEGGDRFQRDRGFGRDDRHDDLPHDETSRLIGSNKVEGTPVYSRRGERLGTIYNFMVDKYSGRVEYAVMTYGGMIGVGQRYFPLPWSILSYDTRRGGYAIDMTDRDLERAPSFGRHDEPSFDRDYGRRVHSWYGLDS